VPQAPNPETRPVSNLGRMRHKRLSKSTQKQITNWTEHDVKDWLDDVPVSEDLKKFLKKFNGKILKQTYIIRNTAPEYFYRALSSGEKIPFEEVAKLALELDELWQNAE
jgi:hypothetical protein